PMSSPRTSRPARSNGSGRELVDLTVERVRSLPRVISRRQASVAHRQRQEQKAGAAPSDLGRSEPEAGGSLGLGKGASPPRAAPPRREATSRPSWSVLRSGEWC